MLNGACCSGSDAVAVSIVQCSAESHVVSGWKLLELNPQWSSDIGAPIVFDSRSQPVLSSALIAARKSWHDALEVKSDAGQ